MKQLICNSTWLLVATFAVGCAPEAPFSGSRPLLCTAAQIFECNRVQACVSVAAAEVGAPEYFVVDFRGRVLVTTQVAAERLESPIDRMRTVGDLLILQGIEDGREDRPDGAGWSVAVNDDDGTMVASAVIDDAAVLLLGACVPTE
jgi:hypothetical protein